MDRRQVVACVRHGGAAGARTVAPLLTPRADAHAGVAPLAASAAAAASSDFCCSSDGGCVATAGADAAIVSFGGLPWIGAQLTPRADADAESGGGPSLTTSPSSVWSWRSGVEAEVVQPPIDIVAGCSLPGTLRPLPIAPCAPPPRALAAFAAERANEAVFVLLLLAASVLADVVVLHAGGRAAWHAAASGDPVHSRIRPCRGCGKAPLPVSAAAGAASEVRPPPASPPLEAASPPPARLLLELRPFAPLLPPPFVALLLLVANDAPFTRSLLRFDPFAFCAGGGSDASAAAVDGAHASSEAAATRLGSSRSRSISAFFDCAWSCCC